MAVNGIPGSVYSNKSKQEQGEEQDIALNSDKKPK